MENKKEKKGIFSRLTGGAKPKKSPCCGGFVLEEIPEEKKESGKEPHSPKDENGSCCG
ncbi:MAG: hypothetical protein BWX98_01819 [Candidatus Aminicenantes bacterium ADurb.Bin147]|nr:MAG: hypothetical protein BWX98_01819 [Candidatus Aminicenantes bacterium ADurb.Bin147]